MNILSNTLQHTAHMTARANRGVTLVEFGIVLLVISIFVIGIYSKASSIGDEARLYRALDEVMLLLTKSGSYKANNGDYEDISIQTLNDEGYATDPVNTGTGDNPWGLNYILAPANSDVNLTVSVGTDSDAICIRLRDTLDRLVRNVVTAPACSDAANPLLSFTVR